MRRDPLAVAFAAVILLVWVALAAKFLLSPTTDGLTAFSVATGIMGIAAGAVLGRFGKVLSRLLQEDEDERRTRD